MNYNFPEIKFTRQNNITTQLHHVQSEYHEMIQEITGSPKQIMEAIDLYHSLETLFRILEREGIDMDTYFEAVKKKNQDRGYYRDEGTNDGGGISGGIIKTKTPEAQQPENRG